MRANTSQRLDRLVELIFSRSTRHGNATAMDGGSAENAGAAFPPTAMDGGSAEREAVSE